MKHFKVKVTRDDGREGASISRETELSGLINAASVFCMAHFACDPYARESLQMFARMRHDMRTAVVGQRFTVADNLRRWSIAN